MSDRGPNTPDKERPLEEDSPNQLSPNNLFLCNMEADKNMTEAVPPGSTAGTMEKYERMVTRRGKIIHTDTDKMVLANQRNIVSIDKQQRTAEVSSQIMVILGKKNMTNWKKNTKGSGKN